MCSESNAVDLRHVLEIVDPFHSRSGLVKGMNPRES